MKFRSRSNTNWNHPIRDDARSSSPALSAALPDRVMTEDDRLEQLAEKHHDNYSDYGNPADSYADAVGISRWREL